MTARSTDEAELALALRATPPSDALIERILDAAREQFTTFGLRRSTVDDVAKRARVSRVTVYRRIGNKDSLVSACLLREYRRFVVEVDEAVAALPTTQDRLVEGFAAVLRHIREHPLIGGLLRLEPETMLPFLTLESGPAFLAIRAYLADRLRDARRAEGRPASDPTPVAELMVRITVSFLLNPVSCFQLDDDTQVREFARRYLVPLLAAG
ncbi:MULTISPECIES: TetR/AcrR family transcriptional regulator [unclassified Streptomyces]|jgi:AcrR family transcriptional regulator|uniref:TetR/AcrR family transcriptional regulator n=1 Tax=unclassified Streptomyces TaxID=2593676 RepID=UPI00081AF3EC|nr:MULTISPECIES: TetR/AcrR family transcriptional regulator [unclassified Streptomyces]MEE1748114.1 TetR family transcriptional regulator [Streptomyces sp. JV184]MYQ89374.1 TetR family transcriptional regulator [Streptomyces sp. SID4936]SCE58367.1 transcriptional regulator, TetR family [Streptomyces sp. DvalAA-43]